MKSLVICHVDDQIMLNGIPQWLNSFSDVCGVLVIDEPKSALKRRMKREFKRSGVLGFLDVLAFRLYYRLLLQGADSRWFAQKLAEINDQYHKPGFSPKTLVVKNPNSKKAQDFLAECAPDVTLALCKYILKPKIFDVAKFGTYVFHPGICPEYRNAHGCFWALVNRDIDKVGMTLLKVDDGIDTGNVYQYFSYAYEEVSESHAIIQSRVTLDNLPKIQDTLLKIVDNTMTTIDTTGRDSAEWGQPRLTSHLRWKHQARKSARNNT